VQHLLTGGSAVTAVKISVTGLLAVLALAPQALPFQSRSALEVSGLINRSVAANTADWNAQPQYSHRERQIKSKVDCAGHVQIGQSKTYEISMLEGSPYSRLVEIDGHALNRDQQAQEQRKLNSELTRRRNESARERQGRISKYRTERAEEHMLMQQMVNAFTFTLAGEQRVDGVDCYVLDARPNAAYNPPVEKARVLLGMKGRLWIDKQQYHWVKVQAEVINPVQFGLFVAKVKPGTRFELEQAPEGDVWLPKHFSESVNASVFGFYGLRSNEDELYSDYQSTRSMSSPDVPNAPVRHAVSAAAEIAAR
jgi:hypothetical protein